MSRTSSHGPTNPTAMARHIEALRGREPGEDRPNSEWIAWNREMNRALNAGHRMNLARRRLLEVRYGPSRPTRPRITPRARQRERHRGVTRRTSSSSRTSSPDPPGESDASDEPEPPKSGRRCAAPWCEHLVYGPPQQRYCRTQRCDQARDAERQRKHRTGDLTALEREQLEDARRAGYVGAEAFKIGLTARRPDAEHSLSFLWKHGLVGGEDPGEYEAIARFRCGATRLEGVLACS